MSALHELNNLDDAITYLIEEPFGTDLISGYEEVTAESLHAPFKDLLVHHEHMTTVLNAYHGCDVELQILRRHQEDNLYSRFILLSAGLPGAVIETGVVRIDFDLLPDTARQAIVGGQTPLGNILIEHDLLRRIEPKWYLRIPGGCPMVNQFGTDVGEAYGRVGLIYCDHKPAIELLEVVADVAPAAASGAE